LSDVLEADLLLAAPAAAMCLAMRCAAFLKLTDMAHRETRKAHRLCYTAKQLFDTVGWTLLRSTQGSGVHTASQAHLMSSPCGGGG
jgi:hypothetical protein